ncbi:MAG: hypothetical protein HJJLKODD_00225 [Phycisphaerae bacterium]|nr:hypothetical protein [Phycisphaerae bacterium]
MLKFWKKARYVVLGATVMGWWGCGGDGGGWWTNWLTSVPTYLIGEFLTDNNGVFDLFTDN